MTEPLIKIYDEPILAEKKDLRSMDWSNRFTLAGFTVTYCTFQMAWEVIEKKGDYVVVFRYFHSKHKSENFCLGRIKSR